MRDGNDELRDDHRAEGRVREGGAVRDCRQGEPDGLPLFKLQAHAADRVHVAIASELELISSPVARGVLTLNESDDHNGLALDGAGDRRAGERFLVRHGVVCRDVEIDGCVAGRDGHGNGASRNRRCGGRRDGHSGRRERSGRIEEGLQGCGVGDRFGVHQQGAEVEASIRRARVTVTHRHRLPGPNSNQRERHETASNEQGQQDVFHQSLLIGLL